jgi:hypothetical protein
MDWRREMPSADAYKYAGSLLRERFRLLHRLEMKYQRETTPPNDYLSCRRALLQGINELEALLQSNPGKARARSSGSIL